MANQITLSMSLQFFNVYNGLPFVCFSAQWTVCGNKWNIARLAKRLTRFYAVRSCDTTKSEAMCDLWSVGTRLFTEACYPLTPLMQMIQLYHQVGHIHKQKMWWNRIVFANIAYGTTKTAIHLMQDQFHPSNCSVYFVICLLITLLRLFAKVSFYTAQYQILRTVQLT